MVEQLTLNQLVPSSSLGRSTNFLCGSRGDLPMQDFFYSRNYLVIFGAIPPDVESLRQYHAPTDDP